MSTVVPVTDQTFEKEVLRAELPVLVDLYADWCQPCKQIAPIVQQLAQELNGRLKVVKVDIDRSPGIAKAFRVQSIPMLVLMHQGRPVDQIQGAVDKKTLLKFLEPVLEGPSHPAALKPADMVQLLKQKRVQPVDVRDPGAFARYRIPGAINLPANVVLEKAKELAPTDGRVRVLYARSTDEAKDLVEQLAAKGVQVGYLEGGFLHWEADGLEVERGAN
jgi:thioredoxin